MYAETIESLDTCELTPDLLAIITRRAEREFRGLQDCDDLTQETICEYLRIVPGVRARKSSEFSPESISRFALSDAIRAIRRGRRIARTSPKQYIDCIGADGAAARYRHDVASAGDDAQLDYRASCIERDLLILTGQPIDRPEPREFRQLPSRAAFRHAMASLTADGSPECETDDSAEVAIVDLLADLLDVPPREPVRRGVLDPLDELPLILAGVPFCG